MKLTASHVDTCLSCYWSGHHVAHLQVAVWKNMTLDELKEGLRQDLLDGCFGGSDERTQDTHSEFEAFYDAAKVAIDEITLKEPGAALFADLEPRDEDDDGEEVYAFFLFIDEDE